MGHLKMERQMWTTLAAQLCVLENKNHMFAAYYEANSHKDQDPKQTLNLSSNVMFPVFKKPLEHTYLRGRWLYPKLIWNIPKDYQSHEKVRWDGWMHTSHASLRRTEAILSWYSLSALVLWLCSTGTGFCPSTGVVVVWIERHLPL